MKHPRWILAPNPGPMTLDGTRTYIVGEQRPVVIDPGPDIEPHLEAIIEALAGATPEAILLTHAHSDHSGCAEKLARRCAAPVRMAAGALKPGNLSQTVLHLEKDEVISTDAGELRCLPTPGHAPEHVAFVWAGAAGEQLAVFVGDLLLGEGDTTLVADPEGNVGDYLRSLDLLEGLNPPRLYPTHGPPIEAPAEAIARFRDHRKERITQVEEAIAADPSADASQVVDLIYGPALHPETRQLAVASVEAILRYRG